MAYERFIARRFMPRGEGGFAGPLSVVAVAGVALGVVVMVMAVSILRGFQADISGKVAGFGSHLTVGSYTTTAFGLESSIEADSSTMARLRALPEVRHLQAFATKGGMVKTEDQIYGIMLRGVSADYDTTFFASCLVEGRLPHLGGERPSNEVLISSTIAARLRVGVGSKLRTYFWQGNSHRARAFEVCGIYNTDLNEMDELYVVGDLRQVQRLNDWPATGTADGSIVGGYELLANDFDHLERAAEAVASVLPYDMRVQTIRQANPALFSWLELLEANIALILTIMCIVCAVAIVSAMLIMIFEKRPTIGLLKALGATDGAVRRIFIIKAARLVGEGVGIGCAVALALSAMQAHWHLLKLDPESYSMAYVPVLINPWTYAAIAAGVAAVCLAALLLPAAYISRISPSQTMRTEH